MPELKNKIIKKVLELITGKLDTAKRQFQKMKDYSNESPSKMESQHDTTKEEYGYLAEDVEREIERLERAKSFVSKIGDKNAKNFVEEGSLVETNFDGAQKWYFVVNGLGGEKIKIDDAPEIIVTSQESPIGKSLHGRKIGDEIKFGERKIKISKVL